MKKFGLAIILVMIVLALLVSCDAMIKSHPKGLRGKIIFGGYISAKAKDLPAVGIYDLESGQEAVVMMEKTVFEHLLAPDGGRLLYRLFEDNNIYMTNTDGTQKKVFLDSYNNKYSYSLPSFDCSGEIAVFNKRLVAEHNDYAEDEGMFLFYPKENTLIKILDFNIYEAGKPVFHPNCKDVIFIGRVKGEATNKTYTVNTETKKIMILSNVANGLDLSPDGKEICYFSDSDNQIHVVQVDGINDRVITNLNMHGWGSCAWSPDGKRIVFACSQSQLVSPPNRIYIISKNGTELTRFHPKGAWTRIFSPQWWESKK